MKSESPVRVTRISQNIGFEDFMKDAYVKDALKRIAEARVTKRDLRTPESNELILEVGRSNPLVGSQLTQNFTREALHQQISQKWKEVSVENTPREQLSPTVANKAFQTQCLRDMILPTTTTARQIRNSVRHNTLQPHHTKFAVLPREKGRFSGYLSTFDDLDKDQPKEFPDKVQTCGEIPTLRSKSFLKSISLPSIESPTNKRTFSDTPRDRNIAATPSRIRLEPIQTSRASYTDQQNSSVRSGSLGSSRGNLTVYQRKAFKSEQVTRILKFRRNFKQAAGKNPNGYVNVIDNFFTKIDNSPRAGENRQSY